VDYDQGKGMPTADTPESRAIRNLISQIDDIDRWRERVGRRLIALFLCVFCFAVGLLLYVVTFEHPAQRAVPPGPRVPGVLKGWKERSAVSPSPASPRP
jgi:hypothetical protein